MSFWRVTRWPRHGRPSTFQRYAAALLLTLAAVLWRLGLSPSLGLVQPFLTFYPAILLAAWLGGLGPGLLSTALGIVAASYFWMLPANDGKSADWVSATLFVLIGGMMSVLIAALQRARRQVEASLAMARHEIEERRRAEATVRENEDRLRLAIDAMELGTWDYDPQNGTLRWSERCKAIFGLSPGVEATDALFLAALHPEDRARVEQAVERALDPSQRADYDIEYRVRQQDGGELWVAAHGRVMFDAGARAVRFIGTMHDITARRRTEEESARHADTVRTLNEELSKQADELTAANRELESFSYSISHDLRAPIRAIGGFSRLLQEDHSGQLDAEGLRLLDVIRSNTQRMDRLIDSLLSFSRLTRQPVQLERIDMLDLARGVVHELRTADPGRQVSVRIGELDAAQGDSMLVRQVLVNLVANALKFTRQASQPQIEIGCRRDADENVYVVRDNGVGFDMRYASKLFRVFERLHDPEEFEGTGVGLAIVQRIVQRHGGRVWAEGVPDSGAAFYFTLPSEQSPARHSEHAVT